MANIDTKMQKIQQKLAQMQAELQALENQKKATQVSKETPWVNDIIDFIQTSLSENQQKNAASLMKILVAEFGAGKVTRGTREKSSKPVTPKYRDTAPGNESNVWSGRGLPPLWIKRYEAVGRNRNEFLIR
ncbi:MAG: H-NS histone family protein [Gammaproteobacteria bacterium]|nr:H-NS histone family protein [Gammaproteobacteria bacterium]